MNTLRVVLFFCSMSWASAAANIDVCLVNESSLSRETLRYIEAGLKVHERSLDAVFRFICETDTGNAIVIRLRRVPAANQHPDALGATRVQDGIVLKQVEVFCDPVRQMLRVRWSPWPALEGWALAKVALHEMFHYRFNELHHKNGSMNEEIMTADGLIQGFRKLSLTASRLD